MNGTSHHRGTGDGIDGCLSAIGYGFLWMVGLGLTLASLMWFFSRSPDICVAHDTIKVIEKNQAQQEILVDKEVCTQYAPSPLDSPFMRLYDWMSS